MSLCTLVMTFIFCAAVCIEVEYLKSTASMWTNFGCNSSCFVTQETMEVCQVLQAGIIL
jgi:hypothetical protein